mmetsp:Transcript_33500/g.51444  ORF Transcript_33500/g.51444 Transcript_33500/m.51444 type:complete len:98 (-) Transcript_33500:6470-6763(-)
MLIPNARAEDTVNRILAILQKLKPSEIPDQSLVDSVKFQAQGEFLQMKQVFSTLTLTTAPAFVKFYFLLKKEFSFDEDVDSALFKVVSKLIKNRKVS